MQRREHSLQIAVAHMLQLVLDPEKTWWSAIDHGVGRLGPAEAGIRKARGVKRGLPDFVILAHPNLQVILRDGTLRRYRAQQATLFGIELKVGNGKQTPDQLLVADMWSRLGHIVHVARSLEEVHALLEREHIPMRRHMTFLGGKHERDQRSAPARHRGARRPRKPKGYLPLVLTYPAQKE